MKHIFYITIIILFLFSVYLINASENLKQEKAKLEYIIRKGTLCDKNQLKTLHIKVAAISGNLLYSAHEITDEYITDILNNSLERGIIFVAERDNTIIGSVFKYKEKLEALDHVLYEGTIIVDPDFQGNGIGTTLYSTLLHEVKEHHPEILRINLKVRSSNPAIRMYERLGFQKEGEFKNMVKNKNGQLESVIAMVWMNPNFKNN